MSQTIPTADWAGKDDQSLLWLASFPRSGNTFTRILLANYFAAGEGAPYNINDLHHFIPPDTSGILWGEMCKGMTAENSPELTWSLRPKFIARYRQAPKPVGFAGFKTHTANLKVFDAFGFDLRSNDRVIYIVRHPLDVLLSYSDFNNRERDSAIDVMCQSGAFVRHPYIGGIELRGSWTEHVSSWLDSGVCPVLVIRYEELTIATEETLKAMLTFLGAPIIPERVKQAVEASRFDKVSEQETSQSFNETPPNTKSGKFFREGKILQWLRELTPDEAYRLADGCMPSLDRVGYTHPRDVFYDGRNAFKPMPL